jgi:hypothetical protein
VKALGLSLPVVLLVLAGLLGPAGCCTTATKISERGELDVTMSRHHVDLRWGRLTNAARFVHPDLRAAFVEDWTRRLRRVEIKDLEVVNVFQTSDDVAEVTVHIVYVETRSQRLLEHTSTERWELTDGYWIATRVAELGDNT